MPLECHWLTQWTLGYHWATQRILSGYTGTPPEKLSWNCPTLKCHHWINSWLLQPTLKHHWRDYKSPHTPSHIKLSSVAPMPVWNYKMAGHQASRWQVSVNSSFTLGLLLSNAYQILLWKRVLQHHSMHALGISTIIFFCVFGVAVQIKSD